jgi:uncharacterized protein (TIGR04255 family)
MNTQHQHQPALRRSGSMRPVDFANPPVVETAFAVVFAPIKSWSLLHYGLLWDRYRKVYPFSEVKLPTGSVQIEGIDLALGQNVDLRALPLRCWFVDASKNQLIQVQNNAFIRNWRKMDEPLHYIHYDEFRPLFVEDWATYKRFLLDEQLPQPEVWQCEVTYINHLLRGKEWESPTDVRRMFPFWAQRLSAKVDFDVSAFSFNVALPDKQGQLQVIANPVLRSDGKEAIQLTLTASGKPPGSSDEHILQWLDLGHDHVVNFFADFTSPNMHSFWGRTR